MGIEIVEPNTCIRGCCTSSSIPLHLPPSSFSFLSPIARGSSVQPHQSWISTSIIFFLIFFDLLIIIHGHEKTWPVVGSYFRHKMTLRHPNTNIHLERYRNRRRTSDRYVIVKRRECWNLTGVQISLPFPAYISKTCAFYCLSIFVKKKSSTKSE